VIHSFVDSVVVHRAEEKRKKDIRVSGEDMQVMDHLQHQYEQWTGKIRASELGKRGLESDAEQELSKVQRTASRQSSVHKVKSIRSAKVTT
ncbi:MAG: hypothetical protein JSS82_00290, partial [Bacteroidetes bacterium]|nr:hypothetical protein [Bacteroidota bacterium]